MLKSKFKNMRTQTLLFFLFSCLWAHSQTIISYQNKGIKCILPTSICEITEVKNASDNYYIGKQIEVALPFYSLDNLWYSNGLATLVTGEDAKLGPFKMKLISQPYLSAYPSCNPEAETTARGFGFGKGVQVKILAVGSIDKGIGWDENKLIGKIYTTWGMLMPISNCLYSGILEKDGRISLFSSIQVKMVANKRETDLQKASEKKVETAKKTETVLQSFPKENNESSTPKTSLATTSKSQNFYNDGLIKYNQKNFTGALEDFKNAIIENPVYKEAWLLKAVSKFELLDNAGAISDFNIYILLAPPNPNAYFFRGTAKIKIKEYQGAIDDFTKAVTYNSLYSDAYFNRAIARIKINDTVGAIVDYQTTTRIDPKYSNAWLNLANIWFNMHNYDKALADYKQLTIIDPANTSGWVSMASCNFNLQNYQEAINNYTRVIEMNIKSEIGYSYYWRGAAKLKLNEKEGGCADLKMALSLGFKDTDTNAWVNTYCK